MHRCKSTSSLKVHHYVSTSCFFSSRSFLVFSSRVPLPDQAINEA